MDAARSRRTGALIASAALLASLTVATVAARASAGNGYGEQIKDECGLSYGQLVSSAKKSGHVSGPVRGAKYFVEEGLLAAHLPVCPNQPPGLGAIIVAP